jgi:formamidase
VAVKGGAQDCPYTFMQDMVAGQARLPWEDEVVHTDGQACGFGAPTREFIGSEPNLLEAAEQASLFPIPTPSPSPALDATPTTQEAA